MIESDENLACSACRKPVFNQPIVMRCGQCGEFQHEACAIKGARCAVSRACKGKVERMAVVRVPHAGPTADEIAAAVDPLIQTAVGPLEAKLDAQSATLTEQQRAAEARVPVAQQELATMGARFDTTMEALDKALQTVLRVARDIDKRTLYQPKPLTQKQLAETVAVVSDRIEELSGAESERAEARLTLLRAQLVPDLRAAVRAIEACRFDVVSVRHPAPWEAAGGDILAPAASSDLPREELS